VPVVRSRPGRLAAPVDPTRPAGTAGARLAARPRGDGVGDASMTSAIRVGGKLPRGRPPGDRLPGLVTGRRASAEVVDESLRPSVRQRGLYHQNENVIVSFMIQHHGAPAAPRVIRVGVVGPRRDADPWTAPSWPRRTRASAAPGQPDAV